MYEMCCSCVTSLCVDYRRFWSLLERESDLGECAEVLFSDLFVINPVWFYPSLLLKGPARWDKTLAHCSDKWFINAVV